MMHMRSYFYLIMISLGLAPALHGIEFDPYCQSRSVFVPRSVTHDPTFALALNNWDFYHPQSENDCQWLNLYITPFYQRSFSGYKTASYFFPNDNESIALAQDGSGEVNPLWFNLSSGPGQNYLSRVSMKPRRTEVGINFAFYKDFSEWLCDGLWAMLVFTPMHAKTELRLHEQKLNDANGIVAGIENAIAAFNNPLMQFGKLQCQSLKRSGNDDIEIKVGYNRYYEDRQAHKGVYISGTIPTGKRNCGECIFEPRIGTRGGAVGLGINTDHLMCSSDRSIVSLMFDVRYRYAFGYHECRSFDLCDNGDWSRYLQVVTQDQPTETLFGIDRCFTRRVKVTPKSQLDIWAALHWNTGSCNWEFGYDLFWRQQEKIRFAECEANCCPLGIADIVGLAGVQNSQNQQVTAPISASKAQICQAVNLPNQAPSDVLFTQVGQLNKYTGAHSRVISNKLYAAFSYDTVCAGEPMFFGLGGSVELASGKSGLNQWAIWGKWGITL